jgi:hypothetical protein
MRQKRRSIGRRLKRRTKEDGGMGMENFLRLRSTPIEQDVNRTGKHGRKISLRRLKHLMK